MKVCIYGAGAIGTWIGVLLAGAGCELSAVARGATLDALRTHGLRLRQGDEETRAPVRASSLPGELGVQDLVIVAVKSPAMADVARGMTPLLGEHTMVLSVMNGVPWWFFQGFGGPHAGTRLKAIDPQGRIARGIPAQHIIGGVVHASRSLDEPGCARAHFGKKLIVGELSGEQTPRIRALFALMEKAGFDAVLSEQIQREIWYKLWGNMTINPVSAITGALSDQVLDDDLVRGFISRVMLEARDIGSMIGIPIDQDPQDRHLVTRKLGSFKTSMLQDVEAGKPVELDALVTVVKELGELTAVPTPYTDVLLGLSRLHARVRGLY